MNQKQQFTDLYTDYYHRMFKLCLGYTGNSAQAEDLVQEVFVSVWNNMQGFKHQAAWGTWMYRIAVNTCLTYLRKKKLNIKDADPWVEAAYLAEESGNKEQEINLLYKSISKLPEADRLIIGMVLEDQPYEEIAAILNISTNNLRVKIHRIKKQLTEIYNQYAKL